MDSAEDWQLCKINGHQWNGITHLPTGMQFRIVDHEAEIVSFGALRRAREIRMLRRYALKWFRSCVVSPSREQPVMRIKGKQYVM